jgi:hypothetical protein
MGWSNRPLRQRSTVLAYSSTADKGFPGPGLSLWDSVRATGRHGRIRYEHPADVPAVMRKLRLPYTSALTLARKSRTEVTPNSGSEKQPRIWEFYQYCVLRDLEDTGVRRENMPYTAWKEE